MGKSIVKERVMRRILTKQSGKWTVVVFSLDDNCEFSIEVWAHDRENAVSVATKGKRYIAVSASPA